MYPCTYIDSFHYGLLLTHIHIHISRETPKILQILENINRVEKSLCRDIRLFIMNILVIITIRAKYLYERSGNYNWAAVIRITYK